MKKETLYSCPTCQKSGFTARGLRAHCRVSTHCKPVDPTHFAPPVGATPSDQPSKALTVTVATGPVSQDALMGQQLTEQYKKAITATREVVVFGAMMMKIRENCSARGTVSGGRGNTGGLREWLREHAPEVSIPTAYRFMALAEGVQEEFRLGKKVDLTLLLTAPDEELSPALRKKQRAVLDFLEGKSQRQLLLQLGGEEAKKKAHKKKDEELTPEEQYQLVHDRLKADASRLMDDADAFTRKKFFQLWNDAELDHAATILQAALDAVLAWKKLPKGKRQLTAIEDEIRAWKGASK